MQNCSVKTDGGTAFEKCKKMSTKTKKEKKMKNGKEFSLGFDVGLKHSQRETQDVSGILHDKDTDEPCSKTEPSDEGKYETDGRYEGNMESEPGDGGETVVYTTNHDILTEVKNLDKIIDDAISDLEVKTHEKVSLLSMPSHPAPYFIQYQYPVTSELICQ